MIAADVPSEAPRIVAPAPYQATFGRVTVDVPEGTTRVVVTVDGRPAAQRATSRLRVTLDVRLPRRDVSLGAIAFTGSGQRRSAPVGPVFGLPDRAMPHAWRPRLDEGLAATVRSLARSFPGIAGAYVQDLATGRGAAWNAKARFPAGSTLKLAIAVEVLRSVDGPPAPGTPLDTLLRRMVVQSDNKAANALEVLIGGSTTGGSARVDALLRRLDLVDTEMYGGYLIEPELELERSAGPIPVRVDASPSFERGKYTTAYDLARLIAMVHQAAGAGGPLVTRLDGGVTAAEAGYLLWLLLHTTDSGKLDRLVGDAAVAHKAGWIDVARHDNGVVYWSGGAFVAAVMTFRPSGPGAAGDLLAAEVARAALDRFRGDG